MSCSCRLIVCVEMTIFGVGRRFSASDVVIASRELGYVLRSVAARIAGTR